MIAEDKKIIKSANKVVDAVIAGAAKTPEEYCVKAGIDLLKIYKELGNIATAAVVVSKDKYGDVIELGADNRSRLMAITLILELNKHIKDKSIATQIAIINDAGVLEDVKRIRELKNRMNANND
jgi:hypothetical protein